MKSFQILKTFCFSFLFFGIYSSGDLMNNDGYMNNGIHVVYPRTKYAVVNFDIYNKLTTFLFEFMNAAKQPIQENFVYTFDVSYDDYSYQKYESFIFFVSMYTGGAHPIYQIFSVVYDTEKNELVTIDSLVKENPSILMMLSNESRNLLSKNAHIVDTEMLLEGTKPVSKNFSSFVFTPSGLKVYFPPYQVAPYSSGSFQIVIPYSKFQGIQF